MEIDFAVTDDYELLNAVIKEGHEEHAEALLFLFNKIVKYCRNVTLRSFFMRRKLIF
ncbi:hypothetical protein [Gracilibacillus alcaliphilus]|uniref:hypothetical protein n=1 Tax=Gracilibacillus alcaliphilus TaxID=1401441 RepID=UPI00195C1E7F|nr:hypothetical protein [Gracilibacillus alcaliphilus]MBM7676977.1 hypothetical protein [Gracilibacillus alcaliphilus]